MAKGNLPITNFNAGIVSKLALSRIDVSRLKFAAEIQDNFVPRTVGPMALRSGLEYIDDTKSDLRTYPIPFVFSHNDTAIVELVSSVMRVRVNDTVITRVAVSTVISDPTFTTGSGWTSYTTGGGATVIAGGVLALESYPVGSYSAVEQTVAISFADQAKEHALRITVITGPMGFHIGSASDAKDIFPHTELGVGIHSIAFTPNVGTIYIRFESSQQIAIEATGCNIESAGVMEISIPWATGDLANLSTAQSGDVIYVAHEGYQQRKIERRSTTSWSLVIYEPIDGPFQISPSENAIITPSATTGDITLASDKSFFTTNQIGSLLRIFSNNQQITTSLGGSDTFSDTIRVTGVGGSRTFTYAVSGTWTGTLTLQRSSDSATGGFEDVTTFAANTSSSLNDGFDNSIIWYRIGFKTGDYGSGTAVINLNYPSGGGAGYVRITDVSSGTAASAAVLFNLKSTVGTRDWEEGEWSDKNGWPSSVALFQGRLWWFGQDKIWGSISDAFESFDANFVGDAGPIDRSIGYGPVEVINWALPLQRMILGLQSSEAELKSSQFDEPLTPTNFAIGDCSTQGSARVQAVKMDRRGIFVQQSKRKVFELDFQAQSFDYKVTELTTLLPDVESDFVQTIIQRQPDTRVHCLREDGVVMVMTYAPIEEVLAWHTVSIAGTVERMVVLPGDEEDQVYYYTNRTINGSTVRFVEKFSLISDCQGGTLNKQADAFTIISQAASATITGLSYLEGESVVVWANGKDLGTHTVASGTITVSENVTSAVVGLPYTATFKSAKLAYGGQMGTALDQPKRINHIGLMLHNTHGQGLEFGQSFTRMDNLPKTYKGKTLPANTVFTDYDMPMVALPGKWDTDSRLHLRATAPRPCTLLGAVIAMATHDTQSSPA
jgi:hypothetical protein